MSVAEGPRVLAGVEGDALEIVAELDRGSAKQSGLRLRRSADGARGVAIRHDGRTLDVAGTTVPLPLGPGEGLRLHIFLDRSVVEVYAADGRASITRVIDAPETDRGVEVFASGGTATLNRFDAWTVSTMW